MTNSDSKYAEAIRWIDKEAYAYFVTDVLNIGKPIWDNSIPTACVGVPTEDTDLANYEFHFSPSFADTLTVSELAFVAAHETLHIVLNHLSLCQKYEDKQIANIAADCVINDYLAEQGFDVPEWVMRGEKQVGYDTRHSTVSEVYNILYRQKQDENQPDPEAGEAGQGAGDEAAPAGGSLVDSHDWIHDATAAQQAAAEAQSGKVPDDLSDAKADESQGKYASAGVGKADAFRADNNVTFAWQALIERVNPDAFRTYASKPDWRRQPTRFQATGVRMPDRQSSTRLGGFGAQPAIVLALDTSGSINRDDARKFVNLARSIPQDKVRLYPITFTQVWQELDLDEPQYQSGGTDFDCIEDYIQTEVIKELGHYPKSVVVITDGYSSFSKPVEDKDAWTWLWTQGNERQFGESASAYYGNGANFGDYYPLDDFAN